ncbi:DNA-binding transcriptional regulator, XRE family [Succiniclasticum ruminis DSM 9236]|uniref:DNA-binding transcriptional regulator, XRE family n=2 Tax=Succiniclasticum ruminis TaxID=40841 RepID=A0A1I2DDE9_9FIRM|nr:DNA-binding transcriptional regulator, XRE family [Succiniclasticum ruminis DSM 9236]
MNIEGVDDMNYNKLWKLLIDRNLKKKDLREMAGLTTNVMAKMGKGGDVSTNVLRKICEALDCQLYDIVELESDMNR